LGILTKIYLDELAASDSPLEKEAQQNTMNKSEGWLVHTDVSGSFKLACELWDAISNAVKLSEPGLVSKQDKDAWNEADAWLGERRL
jgi:hypothetical protein